MSYYQFNKKEILQKAKKNYSKEKAAEYYLLNKEEIKKGIKIWQTKKTSTKREYQKNCYKNLKAYNNEILLEKAKRGKEKSNYNNYNKK